MAAVKSGILRNRRQWLRRVAKNVGNAGARRAARQRGAPPAMRKQTSHKTEREAIKRMVVATVAHSLAKTNKAKANLPFIRKRLGLLVDCANQYYDLMARREKRFGKMRDPDMPADERFQESAFFSLSMGPAIQGLTDILGKRTALRMNTEMFRLLTLANEQHGYWKFEKKRKK